MTATWMVASTLVAVLLALAALSLTRVASLYRGVPLRWIWVLASVASLVVSVLWLRTPTPQIRVAPPREMFGTASVARSVATAQAPVPWQRSAPTAESKGLPTITVPRVPPSWQRIVLSLWAVASATLLALLSVATVRLYRERERWTTGTVADTPVLISKTFGPAIVGVHHPAIVLPEWVLELDEPAQHAIVAHEAAHRAARDPMLLLAGLAAVVVMPWNIGLWLSWKGLRRAIELDCDARVTTHGIDASEYARVLLGAWRRAHQSWLPSTAFAERASGLGARVEHLMRPEPRGRTMRTIAGLVISTVLIVVACSAPAPKAATVSLDNPYPLVFIDGVKRPDLPPLVRFVGKVVVETTTTPTYAIRIKGDRERDTVAAKLYPSMDSVTMQVIDAPASVKHFGEEAKYGAVLYYTSKYLLAGGKMLAPGEGNMSAKRADPKTPRDVMERRAFERIFAGIDFPRARTNQAIAIIKKADAAHASSRGPAQVRIAQFMAIERQRYTGLRTLLATDADRAKFDMRVTELLPSRAFTQADEENAEYENTFQRTPLNAETAVKARAVIRQAIYDQMALWDKSPESYDPTAILAKRDSALRRLVPDEDKPTFDKVAAIIQKHRATNP